MELKERLNRVDRLKKTVDKTLKRTNNAGIKAYLENMRDDLNKFEALIKGERKLTVGVFGRPNRGKSTLLNVLLGVDMLPMKGKAGTTRFGIELSYKNTEGFYITIKYNSKLPKIYMEPLTEDDVEDELKHFSGQSDHVNPDIAKIEIQGPFHSFLGNDITFIDTPGVELGAGPDDSPLKHDFEADAKRALAILSAVDVVIFCMINKYKEKKDAVFYNTAIRDRYEPINVITAGDKRDDDQTNKDIKQLVQKDYSLIKSHTVVVSPKEALEKIRGARANRQNIAEVLESEFTDENLEDFKKLKEMILRRAAITDRGIDDRLVRFEELYETLKKDALKKGINLDKDSFTDHENNPNNAAFLSERARWFYSRGDYAFAISDITKAIQLNPQDAALFYFRGKVYRDQKDYNSAIADYTQAIQLNPKYVAAFCERGIAYYRKGNSNLAIDDLSKAIQLDSQYANAYGWRGIAYHARKDYDSAIKDYDRAIQLSRAGNVVNDEKLAALFTNRSNAWVKKRKIEGGDP
jgi:tetratricopeptide (TPR) repeat protein